MASHSDAVFTLDKLLAAYDALPKQPPIRIVRGFPMCYADRITLDGATLFLLSDSAWRDATKDITDLSDSISGSVRLVGVPVEDFGHCSDRADIVSAWLGTATTEGRSDA